MVQVSPPTATRNDPPDDRSNTLPTWLVLCTLLLMSAIYLVQHRHNLDSAWLEDLPVYKTAVQAYTAGTDPYVEQHLSEYTAGSGPHAEKHLNVYSMYFVYPPVVLAAFAFLSRIMPWSFRVGAGYLYPHRLRAGHTVGALAFLPAARMADAGNGDAGVACRTCLHRDARSLQRKYRAFALSVRAGCGYPWCSPQSLVLVLPGGLSRKHREDHHGPAASTSFAGRDTSVGAKRNDGRCRRRGEQAAADVHAGFLCGIQGCAAGAGIRQ